MLEVGTPNYNPSPTPQSLRRYIAIIVVGFIVIIGLYVFWSTAFINISLTSAPGNGDYSYQIINQKTGKASRLTSAKSSLKKRVARGKYLVIANNGTSNGFAFVSTGGFFSTTQLTIQAEKEKARQFIGDNPGNCMGLVDNVLVSYACSGQFDSINIHQPATAKQPTYVRQNPNPYLSSGFTQSLVKTSLGSVALIKPSDDGDSSSYSLFVLTKDLSAKTTYQLPKLDATKDYLLIAHQAGFIIYDQDLTQALYYRSFSGSPTSISLAKPNDESLTPAYLSDYGDTILTAFSTKGDADNKARGTEIVINNGSVSDHYNFATDFSSAVACGQMLLCAVDSQGLHVYDLAGKHPKQLYQLADTTQVFNTAGTTLVISRQGVSNLNAAKGAGYLEYSFGGYKFNALSLDGNNYILSLSSPVGKKVALYIDQANAARDDIDKQILTLENLDVIDSLSIYGRYIYIAPEVGGLVYSQQSQGYDYDPVAKAKASATINQAITTAGIDRGYYQIINTSP